MDIEIILQPDGTVMIPRGEKSLNDFVRTFVNDVIPPEQIEPFLAITDDVELIFGESTHCG